MVPKYDAILVDEGQDFRLNWWNTLRKVCRKGGEMLLVADATQDIYDNAKAWTDEAMLGAGFRGNWAKLKISYRLPPQIQQWIQTPMVLYTLVTWSIVWKGLALWRAARLRQVAWYIALVVINTVGVFEIIYLVAANKRYKERNGS